MEEASGGGKGTATERLIDDTHVHSDADPALVSCAVLLMLPLQYLLLLLSTAAAAIKYS